MRIIGKISIGIIEILILD